MKTLTTIRLKLMKLHIVPTPQRREVPLALSSSYDRNFITNKIASRVKRITGPKKIIWSIRCYKLNPVAILASLALFAVLSSFHARAQESRPGENEQSRNSPAAADLYRIGPGDVLEVRVLNRPQLSRAEVRVDNRGMIRMPMIESDIRAGCSTESELAEQISTLYLKYQRHPHVDVFVKDYSSKPVAVIGAVDKPGQFQLQRRVRLLELVSLAGGPTERAGQRILIAHSSEVSACNTGPTANAGGFESYDLNNTLRAEAESNPYVRSGDIISLPEAQQVFVVGNVFHPTTIPLKEKITVSQAVAMAGGTMPGASKGSIRILRQLPGSPTKTEILIDLNAINKRKVADVELTANDIVEVPTSTGKRIFNTLLSAVAPGASNLPLRVVR